jgi:hypothetical protein
MNDRRGDSALKYPQSDRAIFVDWHEQSVRFLIQSLRKESKRKRYCLICPESMALRWRRNSAGGSLPLGR